MDPAEVIRELAKDKKEHYSVVCKVTKVDTDARTVDAEPVNGNAKIFGARLQASLNKTIGFVLVPPVDSFVLITWMNDATGYVAQVTEIDEVLIDAEQTTFNGGSNGGLVKISDLITKLNNLENKLNEVINTLKTTIIPLAPSGTYPLSSNFGVVATLTPTQKTELENTEVTH